MRYLICGIKLDILYIIIDVLLEYTISYIGYKISYILIQIYNII